MAPIVFKQGITRKLLLTLVFHEGLMPNVEEACWVKDSFLTQLAQW